MNGQVRQIDITPFDKLTPMGIFFGRYQLRTCKQVLVSIMLKTLPNDLSEISICPKVCHYAFNLISHSRLCYRARTTLESVTKSLRTLSNQISGGISLLQNNSTQSLRTLLLSDMAVLQEGTGIVLDCRRD